MVIMKYLSSILFLLLSFCTLNSEEHKRIGVNYSNSIGIYSLASNLSDESDIVSSIERFSLSYHAEFEQRHLIHETDVVLKIGFSNYQLIESEDIRKLNSVDFQIGFGDIYELNNSLVFYFYIGGQISYLYNAPSNSPIRTANSFPFISTGLMYNITSGLELKAELQSGLFSNRLLGIIPSYEFGLAWRY